MVSGLVTSPCDQLRIFSGEARLIRMESKSWIALPMSNGLERYKVTSVFSLRAALEPRSFRLPVPSSYLRTAYESEIARCHAAGRQLLATDNRQLLIGRTFFFEPCYPVLVNLCDMQQASRRFSDVFHVALQPLHLTSHQLNGLS